MRMVDACLVDKVESQAEDGSGRESKCLCILKELILTEEAQRLGMCLE